VDVVAIAQDCAPSVAPELMAAIVRTESGAKPFAIGINGGVRLERQPRTQAEAVVTARWLIDQGYNVDLGPAQINSRNLEALGLSLQAAFDPCANLAAGASLLEDNYQRALTRFGDPQQAVTAAVSAYNTGSFTAGVQNGYVARVRAHLDVTGPLHETRRHKNPILSALSTNAETGSEPKPAADPILALGGGGGAASLLLR